MNLKWNPELFTIRLSAGDGAAARTEKSAHGSGGAASGTAREPQTPGAQAQTGVPPRRPLASIIAGSWYPSDPEKLRAELEKYLAAADAEAAGRTAGDDCNIFIVPHAGYVYSGPCAAFAYRRMRNRPFRRVLLLAPSHRAWLDDQVVLPESDAVSTPFGTIGLDPALVSAFRSQSFVKCSDSIHRDEHSTQIQYPFLQTVLADGFTI
ncbi:MAG: AmmeMemoRadiSam system protein B, partial [Lentisphaeria bacterium]|nr:AmmeMemoRadiSam system protein B [Lentisphaeria bacterium]